MPDPIASSAGCLVLLDDCNATEADPRSRLHTGLAGTRECEDAVQLPALLARMRQALAEGLHAVGLFSYELGVRMLGIPARMQAQPVARVLLFEHCRRMSSAQVEHRLAERETETAGIANVAPGIDRQRFAAAIARIHHDIEAGDTYRVNAT